MTGLKAGVIKTPHNEGMSFDGGSDHISVEEGETEFYLKSEADKVIAELEENHKKEVGQLLALNREHAVNANWLRESMKQVIRRQKYKRCLANAWWCLREEFSAEDCHCERWVDWAIKWHKRWLELAEKFKEAKCR